MHVMCGLRQQCRVALDIRARATCLAPATELRILNAEIKQVRIAIVLNVGNCFA